MDTVALIGALKLILIALFAVTFFSVIYHLLPARRPPNSKPLLVLFPKYIFSINDLDSFKANLAAQGFVESSPTHYYRGSYLGDFLAQWAKLQIKIDHQNNTAQIGSPLTVIAFDTGDLWKISQTLNA